MIPWRGLMPLVPEASYGRRACSPHVHTLHEIPRHADVVILDEDESPSHGRIAREVMIA